MFKMSLVFRVFKKNLLKFIRLSPKSVFNCHNCKGIKYLARLRLGLSHLLEDKFKHSFQDPLNPFCSCGLDVERNTHYFHYCPLFSHQRCTLLSLVNDIDSSLKNTSDSILTHILLFVKVSLDKSANIIILNATMKYIISTNRFQKSLFLAFCNYLSYVHLLNFFPYSFFLRLHSYSFISYVCFY